MNLDLRTTALVLVLASAVPMVARAQGPLVPPGAPVPQAGVGAVALPSTGDDVERQLAEAENDVRGLRQRAEGPTDASSAAPEEIAEWKTAMQKLIRSRESRIRVLQRLRDSREWAALRRTEAQGWTGFSKPPPFPFAMVEELRNEVAAAALEEQLTDMRRSMQEESKSRAQVQVDDEGKRLRSARESAEDAGAGARHDGWIVQLASLRLKAAEASIETAELGRLAADEELKARRDHLRFLRRKLEAAEAQARFEREDLDAALAQVKKGQAAAQKELDAALAGDASLQQALDQARAELLRAEGEQPRAPDLVPEPVNVRQAAVRTAQLRLETSNEEIEQLRSTLVMWNGIKRAWEDRFWATGDRSLKELREKGDEYQRRLENLKTWQRLREDRLNAVTTRALGASLGADPEMQTNLEQQIRYHQRTLATLALSLELTQRLRDELTAREARLSFRRRLQHAFGEAWAYLRGVWTTELYVAEDSIIVDKQRVPVPRSVTVGKGIIALAIFSFGLVVARLAGRLGRRFGRRWLKDPRQVHILSTLLGAGVALVALAIAMASVRIPWSVFAFAGGAIAIGVGFGAQTLVKNFFTGVSMIFGGGVRVGDIVELAGQTGQIVEIGFGKSLLRRTDGVEMLVPNSRFVEENLINWTHTDRLVRQQIALGVAYGSPTRRVSELIARAANEHPDVLKSPAPAVLFEDFGDSALQFKLRFWLELKTNDDGSGTRSDIRHRISALFEENAIVMAFPQRDVHLDAARPIEVRVVEAAGGDAPAARANPPKTGIES